MTQHEPGAIVWADDFNKLAFDPNYEKTAAPLSKRKNGKRQKTDYSRGAFWGNVNTTSLKLLGKPSEWPTPLKYGLAGAAAAGASWMLYSAIIKK